MKEEIYLAQLIGCAIDQREPGKPKENLDFDRLFQLAQKQQVASITAGAAAKLSEYMNPDILKLWKLERDMALRRELLFDVERERVLDALEAKGIAYLLLKGIVMKQFYPEAGMRTMGDHDILYQKNWQEEVTAIMESLGYETISLEGNHDSFDKPPIFHFEMHRDLVAENQNYGGYYENVWERLVKDTGTKCGYRMKWEDFYIFHMVHFHKHYRHGGCGIRHLADLYAILYRYEKELNWNYIQEQFRQLEITAFAEDMADMAKELIGNGRLSEGYREYLVCFTSCGLYGTVQRVQMCFFENECKGSRLTYLKKQIFPTRKQMELGYPLVEKGILFLPVCYVYRIFKLCFSQKKRNFWIKCWKSVCDKNKKRGKN